VSHDDHEIRFTAEYWDSRYASAERIWSGRPNHHLVAEIADLEPGDALDVGCGEGADAVWLAERGWQVTAADISTVALERGALHAAERGVADRITWQVVDVFTWQPPVASFDLVSAQYMHLPRPRLESFHRRLAAAVRPGGTLLVVLHHPEDMHAHGGPDLVMTAEEIAGSLDPVAWPTIVASSPERPTSGPDGAPILRRDAVLRALRHPSV
jgi:2-polyprenyl-3-methyl-5-hydroxy-6-metoxy-1,4-benzoquinol methylase